MNKQKQYYINGLILLVIALVSITIIPWLIDKFKIAYNKDVLSDIEFFTLTAAGLFYLFSPKYYKNQILSIICAFLYYFLFLKIYSG